MVWKSAIVGFLVGEQREGTPFHLPVEPLIYESYYFIFNDGSLTIIFIVLYVTFKRTLAFKQFGVLKKLYLEKLGEFGTSGVYCLKVSKSKYTQFCFLKGFS